MLVFQEQILSKSSRLFFYHNRNSIRNNSLFRAMGCFRVQLNIPNGQWHSKYKIDKNTISSTTPTKWTFFYLDFTELSYGIKSLNDENRYLIADMSFSNLLITHSVN